MITKEKIMIFRKYSGDTDAFARSGSNYEKKIVSDSDWSVMDNLFQDIEIIHNGVASERFKNNTYCRLVELCDSQDLVDALWTDAYGNM